MRVIAMEQGFYGGHRVREGTEFEMADKDIRLSKEGKLLAPAWVDLATPAVRQQLDSELKAHEDKFAAAAIASSGTAFAKVKERSFEEVMRGGSTPNEAERAALAASGTPGAKAKKAAFEEAIGRGIGPQTPIR